MHKNSYFLISLLFIYLLFLSKDAIMALFNQTYPNFCNTISYQKEYENLSKLLDITPNDYNITYSKVLLHDIYEFYDKITINKGSNASLKKGDLVISDKGLIGIISKCYKNYSEVYLLTNQKFTLSVKINNSYGILTSVDNKLIVKNLKTNSHVKENDLVYTSGLTSQPQDILIGKVTKVTKDALDLEYLLEIEASSDLFNIAYVGVISNVALN